MKLNSNDSRIHTNIGCIYYLQEKYEDAVVSFLKAKDVNQNNLALALMKLGNLEYSNLAFEEALLMDPGNMDIVNNYMLCLLNAKMFPKYVKMLSNFSGKQYEKYKTLLNKFIKACGIHQDEMRSKLRGNLANNMKKEIRKVDHPEMEEEDLPKEENKDSE
eukprot:CAMPEP_0196999120 /NCGR_PEP_ID=MMETSP1380-20130617/4363_1 /TAXON_ID=5936 /ORGANISM="Euplotes crassus, Strain CT5" /LENGTH=160 /DNA_ID=CAMNT_0042415935 /DNA_START=529 /DNA_END=1008 /DNA_ORIENTATION=+